MTRFLCHLLFGLAFLLLRCSFELRPNHSSVKPITRYFGTSISLAIRLTLLFVDLASLGFSSLPSKILADSSPTTPFVIFSRVATGARVLYLLI